MIQLYLYPTTLGTHGRSKVQHCQKVTYEGFWQGKSWYLSGPSDPPLFPGNPSHVPFTLRTGLTV
jgi:hypothetical protein